MEDKTKPSQPDKYTLMRMIGISLGVLSIGFAIAIIGYILTTAK